jgi:hypothetical protein
MMICFLKLVAVEFVFNHQLSFITLFLSLFETHLNDFLLLRTIEKALVQMILNDGDMVKYEKCGK